MRRSIFEQPASVNGILKYSQRHDAFVNLRHYDIDRCSPVCCKPRKRIKGAFGDRVLLPAFEEAPERLDKDQFKSSGSFQVRGSAQEHPQPEVRLDKALVVVA